MNAESHLPIKQIVAKLSQEAEQVTQARKEEEQWEHFTQVYHLIEDLKKRQRKRKSKCTSSEVSGPLSHSLDHVARELGSPTEKDFNEFKDWLVSNGMPSSVFDSLDFSSSFVEGGGVVARKDLRKGDVLFRVPKSLLLSALTPQEKKTALWQAINNDTILTHPSSEPLLLAFQLLCEKHDPSSFWAPYIKILPRTFNTCLSYTLKEIEGLRGSPAFAHARRIITTVVKHYCYLFGLLENNCHILHVASFTWEEFVWATSVSMTRQNVLPLEPGKAKLTHVLIPAWDMCNHDVGEITTFYEAENSSITCHAMREFKKGDQVYIFYGVRSNLDLLLQSGFVFAKNDHNFLSVKVSLPHDVSSIKEKLTLLQYSNLKMYSQFDLFGDGLPVQMLGFLRIHAMNEEEVKQALEQGKDKFDPFVPVNARNEKAAYELALEKLAEVLTFYPTTKEDDEKMLLSADLTYNMRSIIRLRLQEKELVLKTIAVIENALGRASSGGPRTATTSATTGNNGNNGANASTGAGKKKKKNRRKKNKKKVDGQSAPTTTATTATEKAPPPKQAAENK